MPQTVDTIGEQEAQLPPVERILDGLDVPNPSIDALWGQEADDRLAAYRRGEIHAVSLEQVLAKYRISAPK